MTATNTQHTPGPWSLETDLTIRSKEITNSNLMACYKGSIIADLKPSLGAGNDEDITSAKRARAHCVSELEANARLIAAAPELLEAVQSLLCCVDLMSPSIWDDEEVCRAHEAGRAAIAKAGS